MNDDDIIDRVLRYEGGYVDNPHDKGGPTNFGITLSTLEAWRRTGGLAADDVRRMGRDEARAIYRRRYIADPGLDDVVDGALRMILVDSGVLYGPKRAIVWLRTALKLPGGDMGPAVVAALKSADLHAVRLEVLNQRYARIHQRVAQDRTQAVFLKGWLNRTNDLRVFC